MVCNFLNRPTWKTMNAHTAVKSHTFAKCVTKDLHAMPLCGIIVAFTLGRSPTSKYHWPYQGMATFEEWRDTDGFFFHMSNHLYFSTDVKHAVRLSVRQLIWKTMPRCTVEKSHLNAKYVQPPSLIDLLWRGIEEFTKNMVSIDQLFLISHWTGRFDGRIRMDFYFKID